MRATIRPFLVGVLLIAVGSGCGPNPNQPSSITGTWVGTVVSSTLGNVSMQLSLTQSGSAVTGTFAQTAPGAQSSFGSTLTGTLNGSTLNMVLTFGGTCVRTWTGTWSGTILSGTYLASGSCGNLDQGTFSVTLE